MGKPTIDKAALAEAVRKTAKLRVEDVGGDKSRPAETVRSCLNRGFSGLGSDEGLSYILRHAVKYYLAAATAREKAPVACGGCGETEPAKRCIGCLADFGPASHAAHQQEKADEIAYEPIETATPMFQFRIGDGELVFEIPGSIIVSIEPDGAGYTIFDHDTNQWAPGKHLISEDIDAAGMEIAEAMAGTCDAYDKGHYDGIADAVKLGTAVLAGAEAPATSYENLDNFLKQLEALVSPAWRPIETAPTDGTEIILTDGLWVAVGWYSHYSRSSSGVHAPTHWMPLPQPPAHKEGE